MKRTPARDVELPDYMEIGNEEVYEDPGSTLPQDGIQPPGFPSLDQRTTLPPEEAGRYDASGTTVPADLAPAAVVPAIMAAHGSRGRLPQDGPLPKRVLVVDDDLSARLYMRARLMLRGNVQIFEASNMAEGMQLLQSQACWDAALLDVDMGEQNGYELCKAIRAWVRSQGGTQPKIYMITSRTSLLDKMRAKMAGADAFLSKPPQPYELSSLLKSM
ncbi:MAG: PleD family two-component system response regulator [Brachymonas sp.]